MRRVLYLIRHCQATGQEADAPLTELGNRQAIALADSFRSVKVERIISSPFARAYQSILPLAERLGLVIEVDDRLKERVLSPVPLDNWRERLAETFTDLNLTFQGGESSRTAMERGVAIVSSAIQQSANSTVVVTHGNLMTLILKHFDKQVGYNEWENLQNPHVYCLQLCRDVVCIEQLPTARLEG